MRLYIQCTTAIIVLLLSTHLYAQRNYDSLMRSHGMVDIQEIDRRIMVDLKYATSDNFIGRNMYGTLRKAYLERSFAQRVAKAQEALSQKHPNYRLLIYDAARPMSVQQIMYDAVKGTPLKIYVAPALNGGRHNYGVAVDLTIVNSKGTPLDMGTPFDHFGNEAHLGQEDQLIRSGKIKPIVKKNRALLRSVMLAGDMRPYDKEWWHYQERISMSEVRKRYRRLDF